MVRRDGLYVQRAQPVQPNAREPRCRGCPSTVASSRDPWASDIARSKRPGAGFRGVVLVVGSQLWLATRSMCGSQASLVVFMIVCFWYAGAPASSVALLVGAGVLGALIGAVQLLPTLTLLASRLAWRIRG